MNLETRFRSTMMRFFAREAFLVKQQSKARAQREKRGDKPLVHYFHQVDDPYSHLAVQTLDALRSTYDVAFEPHLTSMPGDDFQGSAQHFPIWARRDAASIAPDYGLTFEPVIETPSAAAVAAANANLAPLLDQPGFAAAAFEIGQKLWQGDPLPDASHAGGAVSEGDALRARLGHYQGAMFHFDGEWFWGVDRLRVLEQRLRNEGYGDSAAPVCVPEPTPPSTASNASAVTLEYFPSLRSPYTAIGHARVLDMIKRTGVTTTVRPVMPMLMRGIPAPRDKQRYIITDAAREGRWYGAPMGRVVDPFGAPVKRAFALFPAAAALGKDMDFVTAYLQAAWFDGVDITGEKGLRNVAARAGLDWDALSAASGATDWEAVLEDNLQTMFGEHLWGVPSFRVSGGNRDDAFACWGQDRIWRVEREIVERV